MNSTLTQEYTAEEVEHALKHMKPLSAPALTICLQPFINPFGT